MFVLFAFCFAQRTAGGILGADDITFRKRRTVQSGLDWIQNVVNDCSKPLNPAGTKGWSIQQQVNFSMTYNFLELLRKYVSVYVLLSRIEERKSVAALYATAYEIVKGAV